jgi:lysophospholipase L1-like esterase
MLRYRRRGIQRPLSETSVDEMQLSKIAMVCYFMILAISLQAAEPSFPWKPKDRVVFLGDSNTYAGGWIDLLDAWQLKTHPEWKLEILNLGLPSETTSGLSEPPHPFPRPDIRERLGRVLERTKPNVVIFCYGMNDAIYHPLSQDRFETFQKGCLEATKRIKASGAKLIWMTPPPFDPLPLRKKGAIRPIGGNEYSWQFVSEDYDSVIAKYAAWVAQQSTVADAIIDLHSPFVRELANRRQSDREFSFTNDGVHFIADGHTLVANLFLKSFGVDADLSFDTATMKLVHERQVLLRDAYLTACGHLRPGVAQGKPLAEAVESAQKIEMELRGSQVKKD